MVRAILRCCLPGAGALLALVVVAAGGSAQTSPAKPDSVSETPAWLVADTAGRTVTIALQVTPAAGGRRSGTPQRAPQWRPSDRRAPWLDGAVGLAECRLRVGAQPGGHGGAREAAARGRAGGVHQRADPQRHRAGSRPARATGRRSPPRRRGGTGCSVGCRGTRLRGSSWVFGSIRRRRRRASREVSAGMRSRCGPGYNGVETVRPFTTKARRTRRTTKTSNNTVVFLRALRAFVHFVPS